MARLTRSKSSKALPARAPEAALALRLRRASSGELTELILAHGGEMEIREVRQVLLNPFVTGQAIDELLAIRRLLSRREVRSAIARHRRTPQTAALGLLPGLFWRDLLEVSRDVRIAPAVRRVAEKYLRQRLPALAIGEKIAIARRAPEGVVAHLLHDPSPAVVRALLDNPRLTEAAVEPLASSRKAPFRNLEILAASPRWGACLAIRVALSRNPQTPCRVLLALLELLGRRDLEAVAAVEEHSWIVRHRALELLSDSGSAGARRRRERRSKSSRDRAGRGTVMGYNRLATPGDGPDDR